jgi:arginyl-tRNA synthetase
MYKNYIAETIQKALKKAALMNSLPEGEPAEVHVEIGRKKEYGDYSTNCAITLGSRISMEPYTVGKKIVSHLDFPPGFCQNIQVAPKGFINFFLTRETFNKGLMSMISEKETFGRSDAGNRKKVLINPFDFAFLGLFNVDEGRKILAADLLSTLMQFTNYEVSLEPYLKDCGESLRILGISVEARYRELLGDDSPFPHNGHKNKFVVELAKGILNDDGAVYLQSTKGERTNVLREKALQKIADQLKKTLKTLGIELPPWTSARNLIEKGEILSSVREEFDKKGLLYRQDEHLWVRCTDYGDKKDRILLWDDKEPSDFAIDLCYVIHSLKRGFVRLIFMKGHDDALDFFVTISSALKVFGLPTEGLEVLPIEKARVLEKNGKATEDSIKGECMGFEEFLGRAGREVVRFFYFLKNITTSLDIDIALSRTESNINPLYYVQFACQRLKSIIKMAESQGLYPLKYELINLKLLDDKSDLDLLKKAFQLPTIIDETVSSREPYHLIIYTAELVNEFQNYYQSTKIFSNDTNLSKARIMLVEAVKIVLFRIIELLKLKIPEKS